MSNPVSSITGDSLAASQVKQCATCSSTDKKMMVCSRCHLVRYCGIECQRTDWPKHKAVCKIDTVIKKPSITLPAGSIVQDPKSNEEILRQLFKSSSKAQKLMYINDDKVGILYSPEGNAVNMGGFVMRDKVALISDRPLKDETVEFIRRFTPNNEKGSSFSVGKSFNGQPIFKAFGFE